MRALALALLSALALGKSAEEFNDELDDQCHEYDPEGDCTWCSGEGLWEGDRFGDPGWYDENKFYDCPSCSGSGKREDMTLW